MTEAIDFDKCEEYAQKLFHFLTVKSENLLKNEHAFMDYAVWQAITSRMICSVILMNDINKIGQDEDEAIAGMVNAAKKFKALNIEEIRNMGKN